MGPVLYRASCFTCNLNTFFFVLALTFMDENEEDFEENDSDSDGDVMNMASQ